ncbi:MAG TPA: hypothetical protein VII86_04045 [Thermoanaerobaculia bacterium]
MYKATVTNYGSTPVPNKTVTITLELSPAVSPGTGGTFTFVGQTPAGDIWPGDTLVWNIQTKAGAPGLAGRNLTITLSRIGATTSPVTCPSNGFTHSQTLASSLSVGAWSWIDCAPDDAMSSYRKMVGYGIALDGHPMTKGSPSGGYLVIDTSGPPTPPGGGGGGSNCVEPVYCQQGGAVEA